MKAIALVADTHTGFARDLLTESSDDIPASCGCVEAYHLDEPYDRNLGRFMYSRATVWNNEFEIGRPAKQANDSEYSASSPALLIYNFLQHCQR